MVETRDLVLFSTILIGSGIIFAAVSGASLPGTQSGNLICNIPFSDQITNQCSDDVATEYDLQTKVEIQVTDVQANIVESSFEYETEKSSVFSDLSLTGGIKPLAFLGVNSAEMQYQLVDPSGTLVADGNKYFGEIGTLQNRELRFSSDNLETGTYTVKYRLEYTEDFGLGEGKKQVKTLEKQVRIPKRIE